MHVHVSGINALIHFLEFVALFGTFNLLAMKFKDRSALAASWCNLFGLT